MKIRCNVCWMLGIIIVCLYSMSCSEEQPVPPLVNSDDGNEAAAALAEIPGGGETAAATNDQFQNPVTAEQAAEGWIALFDGHSLFGWQSNDDGVNWSVTEGTITADEGPIGLLNTSVPFADYELKCDFRFAPGGNSGIFLRTVAKPGDVNQDCYELNLADEHPEGFTTGALVSHQPTEVPITASGEWHTFHVTCSGPTITVRLDDAEVLNFTDEPLARTSGFIGLQHNQGQVEFRNILLKPLGMSDLFSGKDLEGWRVVPGSQSTFEVEDGTIHVTAEKQGFLETEGTYGDFLFQAESICHRDPNSTQTEPLNSGYFFRAKPGTEEAPSHGYEVQIHNGWKGGDRTQPSNCGTGGIFRRVDARRVIPADGEWFTTTLVAAGPRIAVWVNGYQVTDWLDTREPSDNPREGQRLEPGHISLQGHDPTTDLSFRNLRVAELPK